MKLAFIIGTGRCGSSLLQEIVARHPGCGFVSNVDDKFHQLRPLGRLNAPIYSATPAWLTRKGRLRFAPSEGYSLLSAEVSPALVDPARDLDHSDVTPWLAARLRRFYERRSRAQRSEVFVHKLTGWPRAALLADVFPQARFVHVVRDGRDVANSLLQMPWWRGYNGPENWRLGPLRDDDLEVWHASERSFPVLAGLYWRILIDAFERAEKSVGPDRWRTVRYEDLMREPAEVMTDITSWIGLSPSAAFERRLRRHPFHAGRTQRYRADLSLQQQRALEQAISVQLERYGYAVRLTR